MELILTPAQFATYRDLSNKYDTSKVTECIKLAQTIDLYDVLGSFLFDVVINKDEANYTDLLDGSTFTYESKQYIHSGLRSVLSDLTYARYIIMLNVQMNPFGAVAKLNSTGDSAPVDRHILKEVSKQSQLDANTKFQLVDKYLKANKDTFPLYTEGNNENINTFSNNYWVL